MFRAFAYLERYYVRNRPNPRMRGGIDASSCMRAHKQSRADVERGLCEHLVAIQHRCIRALLAPTRLECHCSLGDQRNSS